MRKPCLHLVQELPEGGVLFRLLHAELLHPALQRLLLQALEQGCMVGPEPRPQHLCPVECEQRMCHQRVWPGQPGLPDSGTEVHVEHSTHGMFWRVDTSGTSIPAEHGDLPCSSQGSPLKRMQSAQGILAFCDTAHHD